MALEIIPDNDNKGFTQILSTGDFEYVNPIEKVREMSYNHTNLLNRTLILLNKPPFPISLLDNWFLEKAEEAWQEKYNDISNTEYSENLNKILESTKKQEQVNLLKGVTVSVYGLTAFIFKAFSKHGYTFSQYRSDHHHNGVIESELPTSIRVDKGKVEYSGTTNLTDGQLKQVVEHRKVIIAKILDKGDSWHCFFTTFQSLKGEENWQNGTPHYHYILNTFGLTRAQVLAELQSKNYKLNNLPHIELTDYRQGSR
jgi:hypothetical protein